MPDTCAFLLSRQHRVVTPATFWFRSTVEAARRFADRRLLCGEGLVPLDASAWAQRRAGGRAEIVPRRGRGKASWAELDEAVAKRADELVAVSVRRGGIMERLGLAALKEGKTVFVVPPPKGLEDLEGNTALLEAGARPLELGLPPLLPRPAPLPFSPSSTSDPHAPFLWHFTRSCPGPWPGQSQEAWFESLAANAPGASHTAMDSLARILAERRIRACARMIRDARPVVCLTAESPGILAEKRRFRPALLRWDFEPVAVGIRKESAERLGVRPARYLPSSRFEELPPGERHLFQKHEPPKVDFTHELEWRSLGDIDLSTVPDTDLAVWKPATES